MSCNSTDCTQSFSAVSGYTGHNSPPTSTFTAQFGNGWGTTTTGVLQANFGDLLLATEATYSGSTTFSTPTDSLGNTWTAVAGGEYCSAYDCVEIWQAVANGNGTDTVTFHTGTSSAYTYGFLREFLGYTGTVYTYAKNSGTSGTPSVSSFSPTSDDLVIAVAASTSGNWSPGQYYYMVGTNTGWYAATEFAPGWTYGSTSAPWAAPSGGDWAELVVAYSPP